MNILISAGLFYPSKLGGPANTLYWLAKALCTRNLDVSVVTSNNHIDDKSIEFDKWTTIDDIRVRYCSVNSRFPFGILFYSIKELLKSDVVMLSSFFYKPNFFLAFFSVLFNKKVIWSPRGELFDSAIKGSKAKIFFIKTVRFLFANKVIFHATSDDERFRINNYLGNNIKIVTIPNYMELPKKQDRIEDRGKYFLYVGRIAPIKALDKLLSGLAQSNAFMSSDYKLLLAGGVEKQFQDYYAELENIIQDNRLLKDKVLFLGNVEGDDKFNLYANAYFSILISHSENFGNVVIEALSQGTPVITSKGTPWEQLVDKNAGFWINNDEQNIANCVDEVIKMEDEDYQQMRNNAYNLAMEFDVHSNIDKWINVIK
jgi:glycosyltransferase involved in cell wall biosynthesis